MLYRHGKYINTLSCDYQYVNVYATVCMYMFLLCLLSFLRFWLRSIVSYVCMITTYACVVNIQEYNCLQSSLIVPWANALRCSPIP